MSKGGVDVERKDEIHAKGFDISRTTQTYATVDPGLEFKQIKVGPKTLDNATLNLGNINAAFPKHGFTNKSHIFSAIAQHDLSELRAISNFYYNISGIYERICRYFAFLYRYDWYVVPQQNSDKDPAEKVLIDFSKALDYLDNSYIRKMCGDIALSVIKDGAYYGYLVDNKKQVLLQQLPIAYCRSRYSVAGKPAIEFNMKFFDTFADTAYRMKILNLFPDEFKKGYALYKQGKLPADTSTAQGILSLAISDTKCGSWYLLDTNCAVKFNLNGDDTPLFINAIPYLLDLEAAQDLDRRRQMQKLLKIIVQKLPMDKNGDLIFDVDEARDIHHNAVEMLQNAIGADVLTTFTDVDSIDLSDKNSTTSADELEKVERALFNAFGTSQNLFNTDGNLALDKSSLNDESALRDLLLQFNMFFDGIIHNKFCSNKKYCFKFYMLETTQYNYKELSKVYKEQVQLGYSKMLPQIALGHSQSFILNSAIFENEILHLSEIMIPPLMSSTLNGDDILRNKSGNAATATSDSSGGRPEKPDSEKSSKTIANKESMS